MIIFRIGQLSQLIGVHRNTVGNWIKSGRLKAQPTVGKRYMIEADHLRDFCRRNRIDENITTFLQPAQAVLLPMAADIHAEMRSIEREVDMSGQPFGAVMVVGGGIAGIQASLDLADSGYYVYMVEKSPGIGGAMAQLDKTFPTNDCAM
jgi:excisionase family DNA binding protein